MSVIKTLLSRYNKEQEEEDQLPSGVDLEIDSQIVESYNNDVEQFINYMHDCPPIIELELMLLLEKVVRKKIYEIKKGFKPMSTGNPKEDFGKVSELVRYLPKLCQQCHMKSGLQHDHDYTTICGITSRHVIHSETVDSDRASDADHEVIPIEMMCNEFRCDQDACTYTTTFEDRFRQHLSEHYVHSQNFDTLDMQSFQPDDNTEKKLPPKEYKKHVCAYCGYETIYKSTFNKHVANHTRIGPRERTYACELCDYRSSVKSKLNGHMVRKHDRGQDKRVTCEICGVRGEASYILNKHLQRHMGMKTHFCSKCEFGCHSKYHLDRHMKKHTEKTHQCELCKFKSRTEERLEKHMNVRHVGRPTTRNGKDIPGSYSCELCPYKCSRKYHLNRHMSAMHAVEMGLVDGPNLYECGVCSYRSHKKDLMGRHMRRIHKDVQDSEPNHAAAVIQYEYGSLSEEDDDQDSSMYE